MTDTTHSFDIDLANEPVLREIVERAQKCGKAQALKVNGSTVALLVPMRSSLDRTPDERRAAFLRSAGGWEGLVDTDQLKKDIYESRAWDGPPEAAE